MKKIQAIAVLVLIWVILNEGVTIASLILGIIFAIFALRITNSLFKIDYAESFYLPPLKFLGYFLLVSKEFYVSTVVLMRRVLRKDITPIFFEYESELTDPFLLVLLCNAITLPPGTVTVARHKNKLTILSAAQNEAEMHQYCKKVERKLSGLGRS